MESWYHALRSATEPVVSWGAEFSAAVVSVFVLYVGIALIVALRSGDPEIRYRIFRDLLDLFSRRHRQ